MDDETTSNWPRAGFFAGWLWAVVTLSMLTAALEGANAGGTRGIAQMGALILIAVRFWLARWRREKSRVWIVYITLMVLAAPIWLGIEAIFRR